MTLSDLFLRLRPLLAAEAAAEAHGTAAEAADLEQGAWLRLLEHRRESGPLPERAVAEWLRAAVRSEGRGARLRARREVPYAMVDGGEPGPAVRTRTAGPPGVEERVLAAEERRELRSAVRRLPGRCPGLLAAMLSPYDPTYREIAGALGISQGSLGPIRSRCLGCLRRMLTAEVAAPGLRGRER
ncbi:sigma-70 family RNA polymerase sigma factor [Streptomyces sp. F63]|uniref:sigma-70 family RNA polymerase sigma factor n=1 Tax=Streptomyces sp. F63 TaxID=2824887 RepID=UPI001B36F969|nr:sigma-70 family RNA polymerase sigma factor [Streptomyces sp. F63]MBQ0984239.1 sigma-70 family RNA polymerase sigma factor [Streptomyces sp. F63]